MTISKTKFHNAPFLRFHTSGCAYHHFQDTVHEVIDSNAILHVITNQVCVFRQFGGWGRRIISGAETQVMSISNEARDDMQVDMHHLLPCGTTVGEEEVHPIALDAAEAQGSIHALGDLEDMTDSLRGEFGNQGGVLAGYNQHVTRIDGADIHEGDTQVVLVDKVSGGGAGKDVAEYTGHRSNIQEKDFTTEHAEHTEKSIRLLDRFE